MSHRKLPLILALATSLVVTTAVPAFAADEDDTSWDGLVRAKVKRIDEVYLLPEADFSVYTKVLIEPAEVSFRRNWQRDHDSFNNRVTDAQAREILDEARTGFDEIMREAFEKQGFQVVGTAGEDVLKVRPSITDLDIAAPEANMSVRTRTYSREAGEATLTLEARDSVSGQLLGRAIDTDTAGDFGSYMQSRNRMTNKSDFAQLFREWANQLAKGMVKLRESSSSGN